MIEQLEIPHIISRHYFVPLLGHTIRGYWNIKRRAYWQNHANMKYFWINLVQNPGLNRNRLLNLRPSNSKIHHRDEIGHMRTCLVCRYPEISIHWSDMTWVLVKFGCGKYRTFRRHNTLVWFYHCILARLRLAKIWTIAPASPSDVPPRRTEKVPLGINRN